jgi:NTP pyrophosphatase (non-canonical NTP hydrolase)
MPMQKWEPDDNPHQTRRTNKSIEELAELIIVLARINLQGMNGVDPASGKTNRQRLHEETGDVHAQTSCNALAFDMDVEGLGVRVREKVRMMGEWEAHFKASDDSGDLCDPMMGFPLL